MVFRKNARTNTCQNMDKIKLRFFENGIRKRVPKTGKNINALATDKSYLEADKNTYTTSSHDIFFEKSGGIKYRKKYILPASSNAINDKNDAKYFRIEVCQKFIRQNFTIREYLYKF